MPHYEYMAEFAGLATIDFPSRESSPATASASEDERLAAAKADPGAFAWRLRMEPFGDEEHFRDYLERFIGEVDTAAVTALIIGNCWDPGPANDDVDGVRDLLIGRAAAFPALTALFFGEVTREETEISWIAQTDVSPLLAAFPGLTEFGVRGGDEMNIAGRGYRLAWDVSHHQALSRLTFQTHQLDQAVLHGVLGTELPALESLDLYLGERTTPEDLAPLLSGSAFPVLKHLGLRNAKNTDTLVAALADAAVTSRLSTLDLSLGTLSDKGARVLLDTPAFRGLDRLDLHHHYMSEDMAEQVRAHFTEAGVDLDTDDRQEVEEEEWDEEDDEDWEYEDPEYYPAITE
ncbi:hypothetical protein E1281_27985 [Actinomadura sp. KC345]|uniref:STM4015 family protein n=1 Tax=Actinomadura sp. KC345 TaxID=2530371 RepID=UPI001049E38E|nr:STM4015 family protein [Actinomadura sp. KC345]TDC46426.1 hypothetical protein E1281_27985 [Actinomadura sp. KC345]